MYRTRVIVGIASGLAKPTEHPSWASQNLKQNLEAVQVSGVFGPLTWVVGPPPATFGTALWPVLAGTAALLGAWTGYAFGSGRNCWEYEATLM